MEHILTSLPEQKHIDLTSNYLQASKAVPGIVWCANSSPFPTLWSNVTYFPKPFLKCKRNSYAMVCVTCIDYMRKMYLACAPMGQSRLKLLWMRSPVLLFIPISQQYRNTKQLWCSNKEQATMFFYACNACSWKKKKRNMRSGSQSSILVTQTVYCFYSCTMHLRAHNVSKFEWVWCMLLKWDSALLLCKWQWLCVTKKKKKREVIRGINYVYVVICMEEFNSLASMGQITNT